MILYHKQLGLSDVNWNKGNKNDLNFLSFGRHLFQKIKDNHFYLVLVSSSFWRSWVLLFAIIDLYLARIAMSLKCFSVRSSMNRLQLK